MANDACSSGIWCCRRDDTVESIQNSVGGGRGDAGEGQLVKIAGPLRRTRASMTRRSACLRVDEARCSLPTELFIAETVRRTHSSASSRPEAYDSAVRSFDQTKL